MTPDHTHRFPSHTRQLKHSLTPRRLAHVQATARLAAALAPAYGVAPERAYLAGLLHDCARELNARQLTRLLKNYRGKYFPAATRAVPGLWHNPAGVLLARNRFQVRDSLILRAIALHSTGAGRMTRLDQLLYVADYCEPLRKHAGTRRLRKLAAVDLWGAVAGVTRSKIAYLTSRGMPLHPFARQLARRCGISIPKSKKNNS